MKLVKNMALAGLLVFSFTLNTLAGEVQTPNATQPPPPPDKMVAYEDGTNPLGYPCYEHTEVTAETTDYLFFEALAALLSVY